MPISNTAVPGGINVKEWTVIASSDADSGTHVIAHGIAGGPSRVHITPLLGAAGLSNWSVAWDATNITLTKNSTSAGSGNAGAQIRVTAVRQHSLTA